MPRTAERPTENTPYLLISHASADRERVLPLVDTLARVGVLVRLDQQGIAVGENYALEITEAIEHCATLVLMCSAASLASRNVKREIALAWKFPPPPYVPSCSNWSPSRKR